MNENRLKFSPGYIDVIAISDKSVPASSDRSLEELL